MEQKPLLICVVGPTAIGKTSLGIALAKAFETDIISADSRQFYKEMNIGTAVPSKEELSQATHHCIQHKSIFDTYTVGDFERETIETLTDLFQKKNVVILVGGSGLYVDAVVKGLDDFPEVPTEIRERLNHRLEIEGIENLQIELKKIDLITYQSIDIYNPRRVLRALEIYHTTKVPMSTYKNKNKKDRLFKTIYIGLTADRPIVYNRINMRVDTMMKEGLLEEVKSLLPNKDLNALQTVGYRELFKHIEGHTSLSDSVEEIKKNTRRFAKRQGTWFRKNQAIIWFDYQTPHKEIIEHIKTLLSVKD